MTLTGSQREYLVITFEKAARQVAPLRADQRTAVVIPVIPEYIGWLENKDEIVAILAEHRYADEVTTVDHLVHLISTAPPDTALLPAIRVLCKPWDVIVGRS